MLSRCSKGLDFVVPSEICVMVNTLSDCKAQVGGFYQYVMVFGLYVMVFVLYYVLVFGT